MFIASTVMIIGGPALVYYVMPSEEELFKKYNPELQKKSIEERPRRLKDHQEFVEKLIEYSKSDKPIWVLQAEEAKRAKKAALEADQRQVKESEERRAALLQEQMEEQRR